MAGSLTFSMISNLLLFLILLSSILDSSTGFTRTVPSIRADNAFSSNMIRRNQSNHPFLRLTFKRQAVVQSMVYLTDGFQILSDSAESIISTISNIDDSFTTIGETGRESSKSLFLAQTAGTAESPLNDAVQERVLNTVPKVTELTEMLLPSDESTLRLTRTSSLLGRMSVIFADFLPGHSVTPVEFMFHLFLLSIAVKDLVNVCRGR